MPPRLGLSGNTITDTPKGGLLNTVKLTTEAYHFLTYFLTILNVYGLLNEKLSARCGIPPYELLLREVPGTPQNNTRYCHFCCLPARTRWEDPIAEDNTFCCRTQRNQASPDLLVRFHSAGRGCVWQRKLLGRRGITRITQW